jgi:serine/threonine protein kinase
MWAFATKDKKRWFIKQFLQPKYPVDGSPGTPAGRVIRLQNCAAFERRHWGIIERVNPEGAGGGNLVTASDFFRFDATYYKVTVPITPTPAPALHSLEPVRAAVILRTMLLSLRLLHDNGIVHGDIKTANMLFQEPASKKKGFVTTKLIDFDDSFVSGSPPPPNELRGDQAYASPEWRQYTDADMGTDPGRMTTASDIFSLGIVFHELFTQGFPVPVTAGHASIADAVLAGERMTFGRRISPDMEELIRSMLACEPGDRQDISGLLGVLKNHEVCRAWSGPKPSARPSAPAASTMPVKRAAAATSSASAISAAPESGSRVRISMGPRPGAKRPSGSILMPTVAAEPSAADLGDVTDDRPTVDLREAEAPPSRVQIKVGRKPSSAPPST